MSKYPNKMENEQKNFFLDEKMVRFMIHFQEILGEMMKFQEKQNKVNNNILKILDPMKLLASL